MTIRQLFVHEMAALVACTAHRGVHRVLDRRVEDRVSFILRYFDMDLAQMDFNAYLGVSMALGKGN